MGRHGPAAGGRSTDISQLVPFVLEHALLVGVALLIAAVLVRALGRALSFSLLVAGVLVTAYFGFQEWQATRDLFVVGTLLATGLVAAGFLAWVVRVVALVVAIGLVAAGWYLLLYGWMGPAFLETTTGLTTWAAATILCALGLFRLGGPRRLRAGSGVALAAAASQD